MASQTYSMVQTHRGRTSMNYTVDAEGHKNDLCCPEGSCSDG